MPLLLQCYAYDCNEGHAEPPSECVAQVLDRAKDAMGLFCQYKQQQVDAIVKAVAETGFNAHVKLAKWWWQRRGSAAGSTRCSRASSITCAFAGRLDAMTVMKDELAGQDELEQVRDRSAVFDLTQVAFVSSAFLRPCVQTAKVTGKERFCLRGCSPDLFTVCRGGAAPSPG